MKTPQEEAEEMAESIHPKWARVDEDRTFDQIILAEIPLAELIAVARAAAKITSEDTYDERLEFFKAIEALRATGKVEL